MTNPDPRLARLVLAAVCLASAAMPMTFTGPAVALRDIAREFGGTPLALAWVTNAFMLAFGSCLMVAGALADRRGRRKVFLGGVALFLAASLAAMAAPGLVALDLLRALQGVASAAVFAGGASALAQEFDGAARLRAFSLLGTSFGAGLSLGPVAAGGLTSAFGWRAIFALVVAAAAVAGALGRRAMHESRDPHSHRLDWPGATAFTLALALFTCGVLQGPQAGWRSPLVAAALLAAAASLAAFVCIERRSARPMLDLSLFRYPRFVGVQLLAAAPAYGFVVLLVILPVRFVGIDGLSTLEAGWLMLALSAPLAVLPMAAGRLARWFAPATVCGAGLLVAAAGLAWLGRSGTGSAAAWPLLAIGAGISLPWGLMDGLAVSVVPKERAGMATGIFCTTRVAGEGVALAIVGAGLVALTAHRLVVDAGALPAPAARAAAFLAAGDLDGAAALLHGLTRVALAAAERGAFATLSLVLSGITAVTAGMVFVFLGRGAEPAAQPAATPT